MTPRAARLPTLLLAACTSAGAGGITQPPGDAPSEARASGGGLTATLRVAPAAVAPGDTLTVRFALANPGAQAVRVTLACTATAMLAMRAVGGPTDDSLNGSECGAAITERTIAAAGEAALELRFAASRASWPPPDRPLAPGRYLFEATPTVLEVDGRPTTLTLLRVGFTVR